MFPYPGQHEVENFSRKFQALRCAGWDAEFNLSVRGGKQWVSLHVQVGEQYVPVPSTNHASPQTRPAFHHRHRNGGRPCRERRRARRVISTLQLLPFQLESEETSQPQPSAVIVDLTLPPAEMVSI